MRFFHNIYVFLTNLSKTSHIRAGFDGAYPKKYMLWRNMKLVEKMYPNGLRLGPGFAVCANPMAARLSKA